jgi:hypothetical protein
MSYLLLTHQRRPEWQDAINKLSIDFTVFLINDPPTYSIKITVCWTWLSTRSAENFLPIACKPTARHKPSMCLTVPLTLNLFFYTEKWGANYYLPHCFELGASGPLGPLWRRPWCQTYLIMCPKCAKTHLQSFANFKNFSGRYARTLAKKGRG